MVKKPVEQKTQTQVLRLTTLELMHLRDLFNVKLPPELKTTVSQMLAVAEERPLIEAKLWNKVSEACKSAGVLLDDDAPDFAVIPTGPPQVGVFRMATEPSQETSHEESEEVSVFDRIGQQEQHEEPAPEPVTPKRKRAKGGK